LILLSFILFGLFGKLYQYAESFGLGFYLTTIAFIFLLGVIFDILHYPIELYSIFKIEERFGFNKMTFKLWVVDKIKGYLIGGIISGLMLAAVIWFYQTTGSKWWIYASAFTILFNLFIVYVYPVWVAPLFNKFKKLDEGELREKIIEFTNKQNFQIADLYVMDGSKRSAHANAYFTGLGKNRRVVLFDTLCEQLNIDQIIAVLAHEIGHMKRKHVKKLMCLSCIMMCVSFWLVEYALQHDALFKAFNFDKASLPAALALLMFVIEPITYFISPLTSILSRRYEYQADNYAKDACGGGKNLTDALITLSDKSLSNYLPHPWYSFFHYSHPTLRERIANLAKE
jgi:STE24 endopeptidase